MAQEMVGVTYHCHDADSLYLLERGVDEARIPGPKWTCHQERYHCIKEFRCIDLFFRDEVDTWFHSRLVSQYFPTLPCIPMPYFNLMAQLPLRQDGLRFAAFDDLDPPFQNLYQEMLLRIEE